MLAGISASTAINDKGSEIEKAHRMIIAGLEARLSEKDELNNRIYNRMSEMVRYEQLRGRVATIISYCTLAAFVVIFLRFLFYRRNGHGVTSIVPWSSEG